MKLLTMFYGLGCYLFSFAALILFILFANNHLGWLGVDEVLALNIATGNIDVPAPPLLVNLALILLFGLQHSIMARAGFKSALTRLLPASWERSTYGLATGLVLFVMVWFWQPMNAVVWHVSNDVARSVLTALYFAGWGITVLATFMLNHFHLFGLQQTFNSDDPDAGSKEFRTPGFYRFVRHPIQTGVVIAMIATPDMSTGRLLLAVGVLFYVAVGLYFEEKDLVREFGDTYRDYRRNVPALFPLRLRVQSEKD